MSLNKKVTTPIYDFVSRYADSDETRLHMPGHKGQAFLGLEQLDITEISGADSLYEADGIIKESEQNATAIFGTAKTVYSTQGSSQVICAMLYLVMQYAKEKKIKHNKKPVIIAARNAHKAFIHAAALLDFDVVWLWPNENMDSICSCPITAKQVAEAIEANQDSVAGVYITSPDYLGGMQDVKAIAEVCHKHNVMLAVDNAHGAYLHFLEESLHPMDLGADVCCDSAHKTLPVLTGGAYLHIGKSAPKQFLDQAKYAMSLFGSTSPSYLMMASLDLCNRYLYDDYKSVLKEIVVKINDLKSRLKQNGWNVLESDPLKLVISQQNGTQEILDHLQSHRVVWEYADQDYVVFMFTPENTETDFERVYEALGLRRAPYNPKSNSLIYQTNQVLSIRDAMFSAGETVSLDMAKGRISRVPTVSCPPAIPIAVPGEIITSEMIEVFQYYGIEKIDVVNG